MIEFVDSTFNSSSELPSLHILNQIKNESIKGINWWNPNNFSKYLVNLHVNPWEIFDSYYKELNDKKFLIEIKSFQLNGFNCFSDEILDNFISEFKNKDRIYIKIYDTLNDIRNIEKIIKIVKNYKLNIIGGIFLRPDLENYPNYHLDLLNLYKDYNITYLSLIEPLGLLREGDLTKIKEYIDKTFQTVTINLSVNHAIYNQSLLVNEAFSIGINEFEYTLKTNNFGKPNLEVILNSLLFHKQKIDQEQLLPIGLLKEKISNKVDNYENNLEFEKFFSQFSQNYTIPRSVFQVISKLKYFTNIHSDIQSISKEILSVQSELGFPPLMDPFLTFIISQAIFKIQNNNKGIKTLDMTKYLSGYWGLPKNEIKGQFKDYYLASNNLKSKSDIFKPIDLSDEKLKDFLTINSQFIRTKKEKLLFTLTPKESEYFFKDYPNKIKVLDFSNRSNIAMLIKTILEDDNNNQSQLFIHQDLVKTSESLNDFKWRYVSRLFQMGRF